MTNIVVIPRDVVDQNVLPQYVKYVQELGFHADHLLEHYSDETTPNLVRSVIEHFVQEHKIFTAYTVTMALRGLFNAQSRHLPHYDQQGFIGVQSEVHRQMQTYTNNMLYDTRIVYFSGEAAREYYSTTAFTQNQFNNTATTIATVAHSSVSQQATGFQGNLSDDTGQDYTEGEWRVLAIHE